MWCSDFVCMTFIIITYLTSTLIYMLRCNRHNIKIYFASAPSDFLVFAAETKILSQSLDPSVTASPISHISALIGVKAVDFDFSDNYIYFSQVNSISRVKKGATTIEHLINVPTDGK